MSHMVHTFGDAPLSAQLAVVSRKRNCIHVSIALSTSYISIIPHLYCVDLGDMGVTCVTLANLPPQRLVCHTQVQAEGQGANSGLAADRCPDDPVQQLCGCFLSMRTFTARMPEQYNTQQWSKAAIRRVIRVPVSRWIVRSSEGLDTSNE